MDFRKPSISANKSVSTVYASLNWYKTSSQGCVCVCVFVFLRHTSKYRLALLRTVCVRARERLGKKEGKIHS
jgi:hypothetical protein